MISEIKKKFLNAVKGPVFPVPTPFLENGDVDYDSLQKYVRFLIDRNAKTIMVTVGTSRFDVLTIDEMLQVNETVVAETNNKAITVVTTPSSGPTLQAIEFAKHAEKSGADAILAVYPDRYYSNEDVVQYFADIAGACSIGVMIHEMPIRAGRAGFGPSVQYSMDLVEKIAGIDNVVGMKEESNDAGLIYHFNRRFTERFLIMGGAGGMRAFLTAHQWGQPAYLVGVGNFFPEIEHQFFNAMQSLDFEKAQQIVFEKEEPFFTAAVKSGWHIALKEAMAHLGLIGAWERLPMKRIPEEERKKVCSSIPR